MKHTLSPDDRCFREEFEACRLAPASFDHRGHVRLAYTYLAEANTEDALERMKAALLKFIRHHGIDPMKYHETLTRAWILAVRHFMEITPASSSADAFMASNPIMLDTKIMLTHYSAELLFSEEARKRFIEPDLDRIPRHDT